MRNVKIQSCAGPSEVANAAALDWVQALRASSKPFFCALSGGRIAESFFVALADLLRADRELLHDVHFFWADERCVPPTDPESNFHLATQRLLEPLRVSPSQIHPVLGNLAPEEAARMAGRELQALVKRSDGGYPVLHRVFLSMGEDGHVASLFPDLDPSLFTGQVYHPAFAPAKKPRERVSVSYGMLQAAEHLSVLVSGTGKIKALQDTLAGDNTPMRRVLEGCQAATIFTDLRVNLDGK